MFNVSDKYMEAVVGDVRDMPYKVILAGSIELTQDDVPNMTLTESVSGGSGIALGTSNSAQLNLTLRNPATTDYSGMMVEPYSGLVLEDGTIEWVPLGKFWVTKSESSNDYKTVKLTCADGMFHLSGEYVSSLIYPADIRAVVREVAAKAGILFKEPEVWPDVVIRVKPKQMSFRAVVGYLAGCMGCNARFDREGKLEFVWYTDSGITIERKTQYMDGMIKLNDKPLQVNFEVTGEVEKYTVTINAGEHGTARATPASNVLEGDTVVVSVRPDNFYYLTSIVAMTENGQLLSLEVDAEGAGFSFIQPDSNVTVTVAFASEGLHELTTKREGDGYIEFASGGYDEGPQYFAEGDTVTLFVSPGPNYSLSKLETIPLGIYPELVGKTDIGELVYEFAMPNCDVTINAVFEVSTIHNIECIVENSDFPTQPGYIWVSNATYPGDSFREGHIISVRFARAEGYEFDYCESNVEMLQIDNDDFQFVMPDYDVTITSHWKYFEDTTKEGLYSWLQTPVAPPTPKPYWAVFYQESSSNPASPNYYLFWFDRWSSTRIYRDGAYFSNVTFSGYYYCRSKNNGYREHEWDDTTWYGNGVTDFSQLVSTGMEPPAGFSGYYSSDFRLIASNIPLFSSGSLVFEKCENAILEPQVSFIQDGMDVRQRGTLACYLCPDAYSTPAPAENWIIVKAQDGYIFIDSEYNGKIPQYGTDLNIIYFDSISIENVGNVLDTGENLYVATVTNGHFIDLDDATNGEGVLQALDGSFMVGLRNPLTANTGVTGEGFNGILATSTDLYCDGEIFMYNNACRICDCSSTFSLRSVDVPAEPVTLTYTNPMIYEKMVSAVQGLVQGITYTPAKVKHRGNPAFQAGDMVSVPDGDGVYHNVLIMQQTLNFGGGMNSDISCPGQTADTANFNANGPITTQIKQEVNQSYADLERAMSVNNAAIYSALYKALGTANESLQTQANNLNERLIDVEELFSTGAALQVLTQTESGKPEWKYPAASFSRTLLAQHGVLTGTGTATDISETIEIPWAAMYIWAYAMIRSKMFQIDIWTSSPEGEAKATSFVVGNPTYGFAGADQAYINSVNYYHTVEPNLVIHLKSVGSGATGTFTITPLDASGAATTMSGVLGIAVYGIE